MRKPGKIKIFEEIGSHFSGSYIFGSFWAHTDGRE
jgi:hypothetical protein